jgi:hypothetical protein
MSGTKCIYRLRSGSFCRRYASAESKFCSHHQGSVARFEYFDGAELHPLQRLTTPEDVFDMLREALNATRLGRMTPAQAHAIGHLSAEWRKTYDTLLARGREDAIAGQFIPNLMLEEKQREAELAEAPHPLPLAIDNYATVNQPMPDAAPLEPVENYPGYRSQQPAPVAGSGLDSAGAALRRPPHHAPPAAADAALRSAPSGKTDDDASAA